MTAASECTPALTPVPAELPVLISGAGISGLVLGQHLRTAGVPFRVFDRDAALSGYRGAGWGLTLTWALPALRELLPADLVARLPEAYVDRPAVERGEASRFPFYDLSTGARVAATPDMPESKRIRVLRQRLRHLLTTGIDVEWGKSVVHFLVAEDGGTVRAVFDDGSSCVGRLLVACDGTHSRIRRSLFPDMYQTFRIPVGLLGLRVEYTPEQIAPLREMDPFFLQGCASNSDVFTYFSILDAPANNEDSTDKYSMQIMVSWPLRAGFLGNASPMKPPDTNAARLQLVRSFAQPWAEPFRTLVLEIPDDTEIKPLELDDWVPPRGLRSSGPVVLMGDAMHAMAMYRGEGANHAIIDVADFAEHVVPRLLGRGAGGAEDVRAGIDAYEDAVVDRARPGVLASRRACLDAHEWSRIGNISPLLSKRAMKLVYDEENDCLAG